MPTQYHDLVTRFRADTSGLEKGAARASQAVGKFGSNSRSASFLLQNLGEGIVDAQYGFRNVTNNLEVVGARFQDLQLKTGSAKGALAELGKSFKSPIGIITVLALLINYGPQLVAFFKKWALGIEEVDEATKKLENTLQSNSIAAKAQILELEAALEAMAKGSMGAGDAITDGFVAPLKLLKKYGIDPTGLSVEQLRVKIEALIKEKQALANITAKTTEFEAQYAEATTAQAKKVAELEEAEARLAEQMKLAPYKRNSDLVIKLKDKIEKLNSEVLQGSIDISSLEEGYKEYISTLIELGDVADAIPEKIEKLADSGVGLSKLEANFRQFKEDIAELKQLFSEGTIGIDEYLERLENLSVAYDAAESAGNRVGDALKSGIVNALQGLGQAIGQVLAGDGNFGDKFLSLLGEFMQAFGSALIAIGVAEIALKSGNPVAMIAGGVALVAAGSALSAARSKNPAGGNGGSTPASTSAITSSVAPLAIQGSSQTVNIVGKIDGQDLRLVQQRANDSYLGLA